MNENVLAVNMLTNAETINTPQDAHKWVCGNCVNNSSEEHGIMLLQPGGKWAKLLTTNPPPSFCCLLFLFTSVPLSLCRSRPTSFLWVLFWFLFLPPFLLALSSVPSHTRLGRVCVCVCVCVCDSAVSVYALRGSV